MSTPSERVRKLALEGALPPEQADVLLAALNPAVRPPRSLLTDPLDRMGGERLALLGLATAAIGFLLERFGRLRFDGFLDIHLTPQPVALTTSLADVLVTWPLGACFLWALARVARSQGRFIDFFGLVGAARWPAVTVALPMALLTLLYPLPALEPGKMPSPTIGLILGGLLGLVGVVWQVVILYRGFVTASGLRGARRVVAFVVALLLAEAASKLVLGLVG